MKKNITISVDMEAHANASKKVDNISKYLNDCLIGLAGKSHDERTREQLEAEIKSYRETIQDMTVKESIALEAIKQLKADKILKDKESLEIEKYDRWNCGACHHLNFMDRIRCDNCHLPTKTDSKTVLVNIKGD